MKAIVWQEETLGAKFTYEEIPDDFTLADMKMLYKKKCKDDRKNYWNVVEQEILAMMTCFVMMKRP